MIWSGAMMLEFLGEHDANAQNAAQDIMQAIEKLLLSGPKTPDMGGSASTQEVGTTIAQYLQSA